MIIPQQEMHDVLTDLQRIRRQASPATHKLIRRLEEAHEIMDKQAIAEITIRVKRHDRG